MQSPPLVLASSSPRRQTLLASLGLPFTVCTPDVDETVLRDELPTAYVLRMAESKARRGAELSPAAAVILAADTIGESDGQVLLKPHDLGGAEAMLLALSGREHWVHTAFALMHQGRLQSQRVSTRVRFRSLRPEEVIAYCRGGEGLDKAGGYAIQGAAAAFVESIVGSYTAVVGLPLAEVSRLLPGYGYRFWQE